MTDLLSRLAQLRRPDILIRTARIGVQEYRRDVHLRRILGKSALPRSGPALMTLIDLEADVNAQRCTDEACYRITKHIDLLIAMMGEAHLLRTTRATIKA